MNKLLAVIVVLGVVGVLVVLEKQWHQPLVSDPQAPADQMPPASTSEPVLEAAPSQSTLDVMSPLEWAKTRVTKKPFGISIDKATSPVQPERFSGYHTGADFEVFPDEVESDVSVRAICSGRVLERRVASGYGGLLVTSCTLDGAMVTVVYGHLRLASIGVSVGEEITTGDEIGLLGTGGSSETDGERKHLHLGIHRGSVVDIRGYVTRQADLGNWLDPCQYVCQE
jgi:murein DD-endopeptidase MepM/ murein hydrolase activator NlpD